MRILDIKCRKKHLAVDQTLKPVVYTLKPRCSRWIGGGVVRPLTYRETWKAVCGGRQDDCHLYVTEKMDEWEPTYGVARV